MEYTAKQFTSEIEGVVLKRVSPARTRSIFPVVQEEDYSANVDFNTHKGSVLSGQWERVGPVNTFSKYEHATGKGSNPVAQRTISIDMTLFDVKQAEQGKTLSITQKTTDLFNIVEKEIDVLTFKGGAGVKGIGDAGYYGEGAGSTIASAKLFTAATITEKEIIKVFNEALTMSSKDGTYTAPKQVLVPANVMSTLRERNINGTSLLAYINGLFPELGNITVVPRIDTIYVFEPNESHIYAHFTYPLQQIGEVESVAGGYRAYYMTAYAGLVMRNTDTLVKVTGV